MTTHLQAALPGQALPSERMPGHWLLARLGKRVLRPGGVETTDRLLADVCVGVDDEVVEVAPGLGSTTERLLGAHPRSYIGVDRDPASAELVERLLNGANGRVIHASAQETGLPDACADVIFGEAYLTMHPASMKDRIVAELARIARPGARLALHEVAFGPDDIADADRERVADALSSTIMVNVTPLTLSKWGELLTSHGFTITSQHRAPLHLLEPRRLIADEGFVGAARFVTNVARDSEARARVMAMRRAMRANAEHLQAIGVVAIRDPTN